MRLVSETGDDVQVREGTICPRLVAVPAVASIGQPFQVEMATNDCEKVVSGGHLVSSELEHGLAMSLRNDDPAAALDHRRHHMAD